ncbi:site-specific DNA-methyltransferase [Streptococcus suis]|uniref:Site-specific DNA-methyltransferase n=1 Tax=Streptococcus suis TaxID=1307 RepID=A0A4T2GRU5_STRSU|nr:site-specific DNA-methyltransferase [Streptococcus suis]MBY4966653.1 site-specific DNA-methyltransferase [Streptococcus suis]TII01404.1 site-specific DNA-methyltransferase [Streptococcus suis]HEM2779516.1 site-specific DNA-methyltransferase [Streptococcus suis]HEM5094528.1 site-specific DNA-methyltransferase [Streptococcus suis]HEM5164022.1 site-specific DNA-methyltransferase [Streptococcus suis]
MVEGRESYEFTWVGKRGAIAEAGKPTTQTLRPDLEESVDFDKSENVFITGDNLEVLKVLQESYLGKIDMIYIDPPYNTGKDFVYSDKFQMSEEELADEMDLRDENGLQRVGLTKNEKSSARYHSDWLNMMYPRLVLARNLLKDSGVIFISIDDNEQANLKAICDEIFGEENFVANISINKASEIATANIIQKHESILTIAKDANKFVVNGIAKYSISRGTVGNANQSMPIIEFPPGIPVYGIADGVYKETRKIAGSSENIENFDDIVIKNSKLAKAVRLKAKWRSSNDMRNFFGNNLQPTRAKINGVIEEIYFENDRFNPQIKKATFEKIPDLYLENDRGSKYLENLGLSAFFDNPKSMKTLRKFISLVSNNPSMLILDFFAGSATTAHAVMQLNAEDGGNRKYILCTLDEQVADKSAAKEAGYETIDQISRERIRRAAKKIQEEHPETVGKQDYGFRAYKLDTSNFKEVSQTPDSFSQESLFDSVSNIKDGRTDLDLLFQIMLTWGMELSLPIAKTQIDGTAVYNVADGALIACFADEISENVLRQIAKEEPLRAVFKDESFANSAAKINLGQIFKEEAPNTKVKVV